MKNFINSKILARLAVVPFESAVAMLLIISGITSMLKFGIVDPVDSLLPGWESLLINIMSVVSGVCMLSGVSLGISKLESAGLWVLNAVIISRFILYGDLFGHKTGFIQTGLFDVSVVVASFSRLRAIKNRHVLLRITEYESDETSSGSNHNDSSG